MTFIEKRKYKNKAYAILTKKFTLLGNKHKISINIGKYHSKLNKNILILENITTLLEKEFKIRKKYLPKLQYKNSQIEEIEKLAIKTNLLIEAKEKKESIMDEFAKEFIFNSNNIEGSKIPKEEVIKIIETSEESYFNHNEVKEVFNSIQAMQYLEDDFQFNINSIKRLYNILTNKLTRGNNLKYPKGFKTKNIIVNNQKTTEPKKVEKELKNLLEFYKKNRNLIHPLILAFIFHARYEDIHPFTDANGRTGRFIMNKILMNNNYFPIIIFKDNTRKYHNSLKAFINDKKENKYYEFMIEQTLKTYKNFIKLLL